MRKTKTIILIDDDSSLCMLLDRVLSEQFKVKSFTNGMEALTWLSEGNEADLILTDLAMMMINGLTLIENIKTSGLYKDIPVVVLSGNVDPDIRLKCLMAGASDYLHKPFDPIKLADKLLRIIDETKCETLKKSETLKLNSYVN